MLVSKPRQIPLAALWIVQVAKSWSVLIVVGWIAADWIATF
jgi:hypothetical protein